MSPSTQSDLELWPPQGMVQAAVYIKKKVKEEMLLSRAFGLDLVRFHTDAQYRELEITQLPLTGAGNSAVWVGPGGPFIGSRNCSHFGYPFAAGVSQCHMLCLFTTWWITQVGFPSLLYPVFIYPNFLPKRNFSVIHPVLYSAPPLWRGSLYHGARYDSVINSAASQQSQWPIVKMAPHMLKLAAGMHMLGTYNKI